MKTIVVDKKRVLEEFPDSGYPVLEYCKKLVKAGMNLEGTRAEFWNYERPEPEADWIVSDVVEYAKVKLPRESMVDRGVRS